MTTYRVWNGTSWEYIDNQNYDARYLLRSELGAAEGASSLDSSGHIPTEQLPSSITGAVSYQVTFASGETEVTLPGTPSNGQIYEYVGTGDVWTITANAGQTIRLLGYTGNTLTAEHPYACVGLVFFDNVWIVRTQVGTLDLSTV